MTPVVRFELYVSSFCGACARTRTVLELAIGVLPGSSLIEHDVAFEPDLAEANDIVSTPTVIMRDAAGVEFLRRSGVPTIEQVLAAVARTVV
jgi:thioredoxin 1